jgi:hypothetical protein
MFGTTIVFGLSKEEFIAIKTIFESRFKKLGLDFLNFSRKVENFRYLGLNLQNLWEK